MEAETDDNDNHHHHIRSSRHLCFIWVEVDCILDKTKGNNSSSIMVHYCFQEASLPGP
jgi:hypothetical protein